MERATTDTWDSAHIWSSCWHPVLLRSSLLGHVISNHSKYCIPHVSKCYGFCDERVTKRVLAWVSDIDEKLRDYWGRVRIHRNRQWKRETYNFSWGAQSLQLSNRKHCHHISSLQMRCTGLSYDDSDFLVQCFHRHPTIYPRAQIIFGLIYLELIVDREPAAAVKPDKSLCAVTLFDFLTI